MRDDKRHILVVDDEVNNIDALCHILSPMYDVRVAKNGRSAIRMAEKLKPDLILLDIIMPDISGFEVIVHLKNSDLTRSIPVIFISGMDSSQDEEKGLLLGAVDYITKPLHDSIVKARVKTHLKMAEYIQTIERLSMVDALTNIPNRRSFDHHLTMEWGRAIREKALISILMIDIDKFKVFNDKYGHACGDTVLKTVAGVIVGTLKRPTDFASRWGGEEFTVLLPNTDLDGAVEVAEQIRVNVGNMDIFSGNESSTKLTISVGVNTESPDVNSSIEDFISKADKALYRAKAMGRNKVCR